MNNNKLNKIFKYLPWILLVLSFVGFYTYIYLNFNPYIDSDMSSEMVLADLLNKNGDFLLSSNWFYSSEIRVFYLQIIYRLTLLLFPNNWYKARIVGNALWTIVLLLSYFFVTGRKGLNLKNKGVWGAICLSMPFGLWYFWYGALGGFYIPHMVMFLVSLGLVIRVINSDDKNKLIIYTILLSIVCFINGLGGIKGLMALYVPLFICVFALLIYQAHCKRNEWKKLNINNIIATLASLIFSFIGYLINSKILSSYYSFSTNHGRYWSDFSLSNMLNSLDKFFNLFGIQSFNFNGVVSYTNIMEFPGILGAFAYLLIFILIISVISLIKNYKKLSYKHMFILILFISILLIDTCVFSFTEGQDSCNPSYWLPVLPLSFIIVEIACENATFTLKYSKLLCGLVLVMCTAFTSIVTLDTYKKYSFRSSPELKEIASYLEYNGYTQGIASFWNCNVITEWTNGNIEMYCLTSDLSKMHSWLQDKNHYNGIDGRLFVFITTKQELNENKLNKIYDLVEISYENDKYLVFKFNNYDEYKACMKECAESNYVKE